MMQQQKQHKWVAFLVWCCNFQNVPCVFVGLIASPLQRDLSLMWMLCYQDETKKPIHLLIPATMSIPRLMLLLLLLLPLLLLLLLLTSINNDWQQAQQQREQRNNNTNANDRSMATDNTTTTTTTDTNNTIPHA
jgi:hypothetical protein